MVMMKLFLIYQKEEKNTLSSASNEAPLDAIEHWREVIAMKCNEIERLLPQMLASPLMS